MKKIILIACLAIAGTINAQVSKDLNRFNRIKIDSNAQIEVHLSQTSKIQFSGSEDQLDQYIISNEVGTLELRTSNDKDSRYRIYTNDLKALQIEGNAIVTFKGFDTLDRLSIKTSKDALVDLGSIVVTNLVVDKDKDSTVRVAAASGATYRIDGKDTESI
ncbi:hypothetical protein AAU57_13295 [Nonlabens sp. YIK11]|uniref:GIN domain-containing protein n=1 Tax=Nonlabens sp. YIK11 TaxID=1453349 RepID=UPI0006DC96E1|nr:DUF2807 domain-containing protein [Nonlabens sp. YIK11]KQC34202.1 hypothetical protein AAU57_13295 [Nonlabens sp. YIK11]